MKNSIDKRPVNFYGLAIFILISLFLLGCGKVTSPTDGGPTNLKISEISENSIELSWEYSIPSDEEVDFTISRKVGDEPWNDDYATTSGIVFIDNVSTNDSLVYAYRVVAENQTTDKSSEFSDIAAYFSGESTPTGLSISLISQDTLRINWEDKCVGEEGYNVDKRIDEGIWINNYKILNRNVSSFIDIAAFGDTVYYRVCAFAANATSDTVESSIISTFPAPSNLLYTLLSIDKIQLNWTDNSDNEEGFEIDKRVGNENWQLGYAIVSANTTQWIDESAEINETIKYRVYTFSEGFSSSYVETGEIDNAFPEPTDLTLLKLDESTIKITWNDSSNGEDGFYIEKKIGVSDWVSKYATVDSNVSSWIDNIEQPCGTFHYRVMAYKDEFYSSYSNEERINIRLSLIGSIDTKGNATEVFISNWNAYVTDQYNGLVVIDCSNPTSPEKTGELDLPDRTFSVFVRDNFLYVTNYNGGFNIVDINSLEIIGDCETRGIPNDIIVKGDPPYAYVAENDSGLSIISLSSSYPHTVSSWIPSDVSPGEKAKKLFVQDNNIFIAYGLRGLVILDISDPLNPSYLSEFQTSSISQDVYVFGDYAYVANSERGLTVIDVSDIYSPSLAANCQTGSFAYSVYVQGDYVYLADKEKGLLVIDVSNPSAPYILGSYEMNTEPVSVYISGSYAFLADNEGLKIIQIAP